MKLWRILTALAILFAGGISGTWLGEQMRDPLPGAWGWFGAILAGVAIFGGVNLAIRGDWLGWLIILATGFATAVMDVMYFWPGHSFLAVPLGVFPTALAVLGGMVEARSTARHEQQQQEKTAQDEARRRQIEDEDRAHARRLEELRVKTALRATLPPRPTAPENDVQRSTVPRTASARSQAFVLLNASNGDISNEALARDTGVSEATARSYRADWRAQQGQPTAPVTNGHHA